MIATTSFRRWTLCLFAIGLLVHLVTFHLVRGKLIIDPGEEGYKQAMARLSAGDPLIGSQSELDDLGRIAWRIVENNGKKPGNFYIHYLDKLDTMERFHHIAHQPFTHHKYVATDIWINSLSVYGERERSWGFAETYTQRADRFLILQLLVDRLSREMSSVEEHFSCYVEVFEGMAFHQQPGRAKVILSIARMAQQDPVFAGWVVSTLLSRTFQSYTELNLWHALSTNPTFDHLETLTKIKATTDTPKKSLHPEKIAQIFAQLIASN